CEDCRRSCGTAYSIVIIVPRASIVLKGEYKEYITKSLSGQRAHRLFCPNCGSQVANFPDSNKDIAYVKAGTLSEEVQKTLKPDLEVFTRDRLPYIQDRFGMQFELGA
ncbi:Mss4-like protein, partial [Gautieria morchelliformis]